MYNYSPISKLYIKDFRNLGEVKIDFDKSPIIALVGGNDVGKTSVVKAFGTCALNIDQRKQATRIRHGAPMFGVAIELKDNTIIKRIKSKTANRYEIVYPDGKVWDTNKISEGTPVQVKELMGIIEEEETKQFLQLRTYEDQLLFVYTPSSTNYKVMYDALKVGQLTRAIKNGTEEASTYQKIAGDNYLKRRALVNSLQEIKVLDIDELVKIKETVQNLTKYVEKLEQAIKIQNKIDEIREKLGTLRLIDTYNLVEIPEVKCRYLNESYSIEEKIAELSNKREKIKEVDTLNNINEALFDKMMISIEYSCNLDGYMMEYEKVKGVGGIEEIDTSANDKILNVMNILSTLDNNKLEFSKTAEALNIGYIDGVEDIVSRVNKIVYMTEAIRVNTDEISKYKQRVGEITSYFKEHNVGFETCPNCGEEVLMDYSRFTGEAQ